MAATHSDTCMCDKKHACVSMCAWLYIFTKYTCMCMYTSWCKSSLILGVCVCVCASVYVPRPRRCPLSCILKFALRLFHWTAALSTKALSHLLLPFLSRPISLFLSVSLFSPQISFDVIRRFMLMYFQLFYKGTYMDLHQATPFRPHYTIQTFTHSTFSRVLLLIYSQRKIS